jgi:hypothetical protein
VAVAIDDAPRVVLSTFLLTAAEGDREAFEPYRVAAEMAHDPSNHTDIAAVVAAARRRQDALAAAGLASLLKRLHDLERPPRVAALLVNRAGWITEDYRLSHSLSAPEHPPVIEGLAVRDALRFACAGSGLRLSEMDEKALPDTASAVLGVSSGGLESRLTELGKAVGKPWRKEQKLACLAAWVAAAAP